MIEKVDYSEFLSQYAAKERDSKGRMRPIDPCPVRGEYQRDRDRLIHSKAFRRLKHKTQVFLSPEGDHYRTRLTHTLEVSQIARTIARALRLNEDLVEAISLGHDLGHTPFGHSGESVLDKLNPEGFSHNEHSLRVIDFLEENGKGLNLTYEVRDGVLNHKKNGNACTLEGKIVSYADRIAYINHDIEDAERAGILREEDLPADCTLILGKGKGKRISTLIIDMVATSYGNSSVRLSADCEKALTVLRQFMFDTVYYDSAAKTEEFKAKNMIELLYNHYLGDAEKLPEFYVTIAKKCGEHRAVSDYIASMTDRFAVKKFTEIFIPGSWHG